jgi:type IV pilus assembly protein PilC
MNIYQYSGRDSSGKVTKGSLEAATRFDALAVLQERGLTVIDLKGGEAADILAEQKATGSHKHSWNLNFKITLSERAAFCRQMAVSVGAGITLRESLETIAEDMENPAFRSLLQKIGSKLDDGLTFSQALAGHEKIFNKLFIALIRAAEESGSMPKTLDYLANAMEKADKLDNKIRSITAYPMFVAIVFSIVAIIMTVFVLPSFQKVFSSFNADLPWLTRTVLAANNFILRHGLVIIFAIVLLAALLIGYIRTISGRIVFDRLVLHVPFFGTCLLKLGVARFCRNLGIMVSSGVPIASALAITSEVLGNKAMEGALRKSLERVIAGSDISSSLDPKMFPKLMIRMIRTGESSGRLPEILNKVSDMYEDQVENSVLMATSLFEPVIICVFGAIILVLVMAVYLPVFTVATHVK